MHAEDSSMAMAMR